MLLRCESLESPMSQLGHKRSLVRQTDRNMLLALATGQALLNENEIDQAPCVNSAF